MDRTEIIKDVRKALNNRRVVFFRKFPDPSKQQLIINAETNLSLIAKDQGEFVTRLKQFNSKYIFPLIPRPESRMYNSMMSLYNKINNL